MRQENFHKEPESEKPITFEQGLSRISVDLLRSADDFYREEVVPATEAFMGRIFGHDAGINSFKYLAKSDPATMKAYNKNA